MSKVKGGLGRVQVPTSNRLCPHVSLPWNGRTMGDPIWGMLQLAIFCVVFFLSRVGMGHIFGPISHASIAILVRLLLAMAMEI